MFRGLKRIALVFLLFKTPAYSAGKVVQLIDTSDGKNAVYLDQGKRDGLLVGQLLKVYRVSGSCDHPSGEKVETGRIKLVSLNKETSYGEVISSGSDLSKIVYPKFPGLMAEDCTEAVNQVLTQNPKLLPTKAISYFDLFDDPKDTPLSFELSEEGKKTLKEVAEIYAGARVSLLMIEGHTDQDGPSDANQVESDQRAKTVKQYLVNQLGFDSSRLLALGFGESELEQPNYVSGYKRKNRRIVFRVGD